MCTQSYFIVIDIVLFVILSKVTKINVQKEKNRAIIKNVSMGYNIKKHQNHKEAMWVDEQPTPSPPGARVVMKTSFP